jgi:hypothetical protein
VAPNGGTREQTCARFTGEFTKLTLAIERPRLTTADAKLLMDEGQRNNKASEEQQRRHLLHRLILGGSLIMLLATSSMPRTPAGAEAPVGRSVQTEQPMRQRQVLGRSWRQALQVKVPAKREEIE